MNPYCKNTFRLLSLFMMMILASCSNTFEFDKLSTDNLKTEWAVPLINSELTLEDLLNDSTGIINTNDDGFVTLVYESKQLVSIDAEQQTTIPNQQKILNEGFSIPDIPDWLPDTTITLPQFDFGFEFEMVDETHRIDSMYLKSGTYSLTLTSNINKEQSKIDIQIPNFIHTQTGEYMQFTFDMGYDGISGTYIKDTVIDLSDYYVQFDNEVNKNRVIILADITFTTDDTENLSPYYFDLENHFDDIEFATFFGYIGFNQEVFSDTIDLQIFNSNELGSLSFGPGSAKVYLDIYNSLGVPIRLDVEKFTAYHSGSQPDSIDFHIFGEGVPAQIEINYPESGQIGEDILTEIDIVNSNITDVLEISPNKMYLKLVGNLNYDEDSTIINSFIDTSDIKIDVNIELDMFGGTDSFLVQDTIDFEFDSFEGINALEFLVDITNGFPITAFAQVQFVNENYEVLHSLLGDGEELIVAADVGPGPDYKVISPSNKNLLIVVEKEELDMIQTATQIIFKADVSTEDGQNVKIYTEYGIELKLGAKVLYSI